MKIVLAFLLCFSAAEARRKKKTVVTTELTAVVETCHDGDTCRMRSEAKVLSVRFSGVDAPELDQTSGHAAQRFTENLLTGKTVTLKCTGRSYKRTVCTVFLNGQDVNRQLVQAGWAFESPRFSHGIYADDEKAAREKRIGLWESRDAVSPHCFRHKKDKHCRVNVQYMP